MLTGVSSAAASFADPAGDDNAAPDITGLTVAESSPDAITVTVSVANYPTLPPNAWLNLWFDLDSNPQTGIAGSDALVRYLATGVVEFLRPTGSDLALQPSTGITARYEAGRLTATIPKASLSEASSIGVLAVGLRRQQLGAGAFVASDFAPASGHYRWNGPAEASFTDATGDNERAPDITSVRVSDTKDGWIRFAITTPNFTRLEGATIVAIELDADGRSGTGQNGVDLIIPNVGGEVQLQRWNGTARRWESDPPPNRLRVRNAAHVLTTEIHRSKLGTSPRFGFRIVSAMFDPRQGTPFAVDLAPNNGSFWRYTFANAPALRLIAGRSTGAPRRPVAGRPFTISTPVRRSDTNRAITAGRVSCNVRAAGRRVPARGSVRGGRGHCALVVPAQARSIAGSMTIRTAGRAVTARFSFPVR